MWADLSEQLKGTVKSQTLYTIVKLNIHDSWKIVGIHSENIESDDNTDEAQEIQSSKIVEIDLEAESVDCSITRCTLSTLKTQMKLTFN